MTRELQNIQSTYDNTTGKKYNTRMTMQLQKVQYKYGNTTAKSTIYV